MRGRWLALMLLAATLPAACADAERVVTSQELAETPQRAPVYRIGWTSDAYGAQVHDFPRPNQDFNRDCYSRVVVGQIAPAGCLTVGALRRETDAFARSERATYLSAFVVMVALIWFAARRISWMPTVAPSEGHRGLATAGGAVSAVDLMRSVEVEKGSRAVATAGAHDIPHPAWFGLGSGLLMLAAATLVVGYGTSLSWGLATGTVMILGVIAVGAALLLGLLSRRSVLEPFIRRLLFLSGVTVALLAASAPGLSWQWPMAHLNGLGWPF